MLFNRKLSIDNHVQIVHINPMLILLMLFSLTWNVLSNLLFILVLQYGISYQLRPKMHRLLVVLKISINKSIFKYILILMLSGF